MIVGNNLRVLTWMALALLLVPPTALVAKTNKKAAKLLQLARDAEARKDYDVALDYYNQAISTDASNPAYEMGMRRVRFEASEVHVKAGQALRTQGKLEESVAEFQRAFTIDPSSSIALQELKRTMEMQERNKKGNLSPKEQTLTAVELERQRAEERMGSLESVPQLKPITPQISTLKMNNQPPRVLYETVGKLAGINVVFDPQFQFNGKNVNLDLTNATLQEALDYIGMLTKTFWKPISANTIFVAEDNVTKRRDYEDEVVKVFYLKNVTSVQEFQEIVTAVRSVTDIRRCFTYGAQNAVMCRGTVDQVALAEKLFHDLDKPKSEVLVDVIVMEVNSDHVRNIAAGLTSGSTTGLVIPVGFTPRNPVTVTNPGSTTGTSTTGEAGGITNNPTTTTANQGGSSISVSQIGKVSFSDFSLSLPGLLLQAVATDNSTRVLQSPQVRASDGQKVDLKIGDRIPYATGSFQPGIGTVGVSPLVSTQFQFADTGVNLTVTPHVHGTDELTLHVMMDISNVSRSVTIGGLEQPVISQRKSETEIRLRDGEVSLLGGLMQGQNTNSSSGIPGIVNIPVLGHLFFGSSNKETVRQELLIALVPHIIRSTSITPMDMQTVQTGVDQVVKVRYSAQSSASPVAAAKTTPEPTAAQPAPAQPPAAVPAPAPATPTAPSPGAPTVPSVPAGTQVLRLTPASAQVPLSSPLMVAVEAINVTDLFTAPIHIKWDPKLLRLNQVTAGKFMGDGGPQANPPTIDIRNETGDASITVSRVTGAPGVNGSGELALLTFMAVGKGAGTIAVSEPGLRNSKQESIAAAGPTMAVTVQ